MIFAQTDHQLDMFGLPRTTRLIVDVNRFRRIENRIRRRPDAARHASRAPRPRAGGNQEGRVQQNHLVSYRPGFALTRPSTRPNIGRCKSTPRMIPIRDTIPRSTPPIATWLIILVNWLVFLFELTMPEHTLVQFFYRFGLVPARYSHPAWTLWLGLPVDDYFPFLTSMFIHGGWLHIIANMWALWIFGDNVEDRMGTGATDALKFPEIIALVPFSTATHGFDTVSG